MNKSGRSREKIYGRSQQNYMVDPEKFMADPKKSHGRSRKIPLPDPKKIPWSIQKKKLRNGQFQQIPWSIQRFSITDLEKNSRVNPENVHKRIVQAPNQASPRNMSPEAELMHNKFNIITTPGYRLAA